MSKDKKNIDNKLISVFKTVFTISAIALLTYVIMAIITHFSLNYETETYKFSQSLEYVFNTNSAIFKFFLGFVLLNVSWILLAIFINFLKKQIVK
ncbi:MAG: hypothetical protein GXO49_06960 [Chlorobi bacterium]|nr:hypothetical protein [Chlorobiota bacterium]